MDETNSRPSLSVISDACRSNGSLAVVTVLDSGSVFKFLVPARQEADEPAHPHWPISAEPPDRDWTPQAVKFAEETIQSRSPANLVDLSAAYGRSLTVSVEVIRPKSSILIFGAGHVGQALALMSALAGYPVTIVDDREHFLSRDRLPDRNILLRPGPFEQLAGEISISRSTAVVIVTRGHQWDEVCLREVADSEAGYIGMIGSKRRVIAVFERLIRAGVPAESLGRVKAPIGLEIGARSPQEIAVAILAQIIETFNCPATR